MKLPMPRNSLFCAMSLLFFSSSTTKNVGTEAIPFRGRSGSGGKQDDDNGDNSNTNAAAVVVDPTIIELYPHSTSDKGENSERRNAALERYLLMGDAASSKELAQEIRNHAHNITEFLRSTRRTLHRTPELMFNEKTTSQVVQSVLTELGIPYTNGWAVNTNPDAFPGPGGYGVVADIGTGQEPCVLLRADMDALPIYERTEGIDEFRSQVDNKMHACGHDGHTTMLLGAASLLKSMEHSINGTIRLMVSLSWIGGCFKR